MTAMNLADPELELIDPTPNVHALFLQFDKTFFFTKLASRAVVRWSKRMYSCAGICSYDRGGLCDIALSEPLLKLRPRKDLVETLLHEMIHAFLFITCQDQDRDGHGPNFKAHMYRINKAAGLNISIYHDFHDEVKLYQNHWWRCNGPCQTKRPHFGIVRRFVNRPPGTYDYWWNDHKRKCGGTFVKIKEPENTGKKKTGKSNGNTTKSINNNNNKISVNKNITTIDTLFKPVLKDSNMNKSKSNSNSTLVVSKKNNVVFDPQITKPVVFSGNGHVTSEKPKLNDSTNVLETVRNVWANKNLPISITASQIAKPVKKRNNLIISDTQKNSVCSPAKKIKKIDDYFKSTATNVLKDIYGQDFDLTQSKKDEKLIAVPVKIVPDNLVDCPICNIKVRSDMVNQHIDECLSKDVIEELSKNNIQDGNLSVISNNNDSKKIVENSVVKPMSIKGEQNDCIDLTNIINVRPTREYPMTKIEIKKEVDIKPTNFVKTEKETNQVISLETFPKIEVKVEPGCSQVKSEQICPCCGKSVTKSLNEHLDECLAFFDNNTTIPEEGASTSFSNETIVIDDDDIFDESSILNETGTKSPCPCCMKMVEMTDMNSHLDICLVSS